MLVIRKIFFPVEFSINKEDIDSLTISDAASRKLLDQVSHVQQDVTIYPYNKGECKRLEVIRVEGTNDTVTSRTKLDFNLLKFDKLTD